MDLGTKKISWVDTGNRVLMIAIVALFGCAVIKWFDMDTGAEIEKDISQTVEKQVSAREAEATLKRPFVVYAQRIEARNLFQPLTEKLKPDEKLMAKALPALHKRIKLIGILYDKDSKAIVEDLKEQQTHFLSKGESVGAAFLEDIREDKVIFVYNNEQVEMSL